MCQRCQILEKENAALRLQITALSGDDRTCRNALLRLVKICEFIRAGDFPNATTIARHLGLSTKTIHRDMNVLRFQMLLPIEYNARRLGYHLTGEIDFNWFTESGAAGSISRDGIEKVLSRFNGRTA